MLWIISIIIMSKEEGLVIGTIIFLFLGVAAALAFYVYVGMRSPIATKAANRT